MTPVAVTKDLHATMALDVEDTDQAFIAYNLVSLVSTPHNKIVPPTKSNFASFEKSTQLMGSLASLYSNWSSYSGEVNGWVKISFTQTDKDLEHIQWSSVSCRRGLREEMRGVKGFFQPEKHAVVPFYV